jgi:cell division protein FtsB
MNKISILLLIIVSSVLQCKLWFRPDGVHGIIKINQSIKQQEMELNDLRLRNEKLFESIKLLKQNPQAIEEYARVNFGMIKKDEIYYRIIE